MNSSVLCARSRRFERLSDSDSLDPRRFELRFEWARGSLLSVNEL